MDCLNEKDTHFVFPIIGENGVLREATRLERIIVYGMKDELHDGEVISNNKIINVEIPKDIVYPIWNRDKNIWEEGATRDYLLRIQRNKIVEYNKAKSELLILSEYNDQFDTKDSIDIVKKEIEFLEEYIIFISKKIQDINKKVVSYES